MTSDVVSAIEVDLRKIAGIAKIANVFASPTLINGVGIFAIRN